MRIGNSRGIRIPKPIIEQCGFGETVELRVEKDRLIIAADQLPREGWREEFAAANKIKSRSDPARGGHTQCLRYGGVELVSFPRRDEVWLVTLDPTQGSEIQKTRLCLIVSPNETNEYLRTVIVAPMTTTERPYPTRFGLTFQSRRGQVVLDQIRAIDRDRLIRKLGTAPAKTVKAVSAVLVEMFTR